MYMYNTVSLVERSIIHVHVYTLSLVERSIIHVYTCILRGSSLCYLNSLVDLEKCFMFLLGRQLLDSLSHFLSLCLW